MNVFGVVHVPDCRMSSMDVLLNAFSECATALTECGLTPNDFMLVAYFACANRASTMACLVYEDTVAAEMSDFFCL